MPFSVKAFDTSGKIALVRETRLAALKKASELIADGCWDVEITAPDGSLYSSAQFDVLTAETDAGSKQDA